MKLARFSVDAILLAAVVFVIPALAAEGAKDANAVPAIETDVTQGALRVQQADGSVVECPLKHTDVVADISGFIARVKVTQTFYNPFKDKIEAVYVFPLPHGSAVDDMTMVIGDRRIVGIIRKRAEARWIYEYALRRGRTAALLEQERPNIFTQSVGNIAPNQEINIEISYLDVLEYDMGEYTFHFPMVVGPRYNPPGYKGGIGAVPHAEPGSQVEPVPPVGVKPPAKGVPAIPEPTDPAPEARHDAVVPYLKPGQRTGHDISLSVSLDAGVPVRDIKVTNHKAAIERFDAHLAKVTLSPGDSIPNKDFVLKYKVVGEKPEIALLAHSIGQGSDGYFMLMIQPRIDEGLKKAPPREICFLIDVSGSMSGRPTQKVRDTMEEFFKLSKPDDTIQVVTFAGRAQELFDKYVPATKDNVRKALNFTRGIRGGGGTNMLEGIKKVVDAPVDPKRVRIVVMLTDGFIGNEDQIIKEVADKCGDRIRFWTIGIGSSPNRHLIDGVARQGGGMGKVLGLNDDPAELVPQIVERIHRAQLADIDIDWGTLPVHEIYPMKIPELWAGRPVILFGRYYGSGQGTVTINGTAEGEPISYSVTVALPQTQPQHSVLAQVWARRKIRDLTDQMAGTEVPELVEEITRIALNYSLMSKYTSFVAVDEKDADKLTAPPTPPRRVAVPVPMPDGVSWEGVFAPEGRELLAQGEVAEYKLAITLEEGAAAMGSFHGVYGSRGGALKAKKVQAVARLGVPSRERLERAATLAAPLPSAPGRPHARRQVGADALGVIDKKGLLIVGAPPADDYGYYFDALEFGEMKDKLGEDLAERIREIIESQEGKTTDKVTLNFKDTPLKDAFTYLSEATGVKIIIDAEAREEVAGGGIRLKLKNVPLPVALNRIVQGRGLRYEVKGNAIHIALTDYKRAEILVQDAQKAEEAGKLSEACAIFKRACLVASASRHRRARWVADRAIAGVFRTRRILRDEYVKKLPALEGRLDILIRRKPLSDAITAVSKAAGVEINVVPGSFGDVKRLLELDRLEVIYLDLRNATVAQALDWLLDPFRLNYQIDGEKVTVGTSRRLMKDTPTSWVYQVGFIATPTKEELGEDKAANRKLVTEAPREVLEAVQSVIGPGKAELLRGGRLMVCGTSADHSAVGYALTVLRTGKMLEPPGEKVVALVAKTAKRYAAHAELRAKRIAAKQRRAVAEALAEYSWELMAGALAGEADLEALTYLQFAWNHPQCPGAIKELREPLAGRSLWAVCEAARLLGENAEVRELAEKAADAGADAALAAAAAPKKDIYTEIQLLEYALAARSLAAAGIKNEKLGAEFLKTASRRLAKAESWVATAASALLYDLDAAARDALVKKLPNMDEGNLRDDDAVVLYSFACRRAGGDAWESFRRIRTNITSGGRRAPLSGDALLITNRLADPKLALAR